MWMQTEQIPLYMVPSRPSFLGVDFGTFCEGAYSTKTLYWAPEMNSTV